MIAGVSIDHPAVPVKKEPVRATIYCGGWIAIPLGPKLTRMIYIASANPNGDIPNMFKPKAAYTAGGMPKCLKDYVHKRDKIKK